MEKNNLITLLTLIAISSGEIIGSEFDKKELKRKVLDKKTTKIANIDKYKNNQKSRNKSHIVYRTMM